MRPSRSSAVSSSLTLIAGAAIVASVWFGFQSQAAETPIIPAPTADIAQDQRATAVAVLAGGCFWGVQAVFQQVEGVKNAVSGYAGGAERDANYDKVSAGATRHAEAVRITYDPRKISYGKILQIYFSVAHDPTELNRQGPDVGPQYRSTIFPLDADQERIAKSYIAQLDAARIYRRAIATTIETDKPFYPAEGYHQDFMAKHPNHPYILAHDAPKIAHLMRIFPDVYRAKPVLTAHAAD